MMFFNGLPRTAWLVPAMLAAMSLSMPLPLQAAIVTYNVTLTGPQEAPPNASPGVGSGQVFVDTVAHTLRVVVSFSGLQGNTTAAHIHAATTVPGVGTAGVATQTPSVTGFPQGVRAGSYDRGNFDMTQASSFNAAYITANGGTPASAEAALAAAIESGRAYLNIHSSVVPAGEIRGFLTAVPEPSSLVLSGLAAIGLVMRYRSRQRRAMAE